MAGQIDHLNLLSDEAPHLPFAHRSQVDGERFPFPAALSRSLTRVPGRAVQDARR